MPPMHHLSDYLQLRGQGVMEVELLIVCFWGLEMAMIIAKMSLLVTTE